MFSTIRDKALRNIHWSLPPHEVGFIEAFEPGVGELTTPENFQHGYLRESEISDWLEKRDTPYAPASPVKNKVSRGGIRLLFLEREYYRPLSFPVSLRCFLDIEKSFCLAPATLRAFSNDSGAYSRFLEHQTSDPQKLKRLWIVIKFAQKYQVGNWALSYCYDFQSGFATGIAHGTGLLSRKNDYRLWEKTPFEEVVDLLILLQIYVSRFQTFCVIDLDNRVLEIQRRLGTSRAGRLHGRGALEDPVGQKTIHDTRSNLQNLTSEMSTCTTETIWLSSVADNLDNCIEFLLKTSAESAKSCLLDGTDITECMEYIKSIISGVRVSVKSHKDIMICEFSVLNCIISQVDNRLNAKMAASTSRDSTAMKALAFVTTIFLPATAVASIFSMSIFDWQSTERVVSSKIWIYWTVSIPLTVLVAILLRVWWSWEKRNFDKDVLHEINEMDRVAEPKMIRKPLVTHRWWPVNKVVKDSME